MAKQNLKFTMTIEYDPAANDNKPAHIYLFQFLTRLNREWPILDVEYNGIKKDFRLPANDINKIALRKIDSLDNTKLPKPPAWLKDKTVLPQEPKIKKIT